MICKQDSLSVCKLLSLVNNGRRSLEATTRGCLWEFMGFNSRSRCIYGNQNNVLVTSSVICPLVTALDYVFPNANLADEFMV